MAGGLRGAPTGRLSTRCAEESHQKGTGGTALGLLCPTGAFWRWPQGGCGCGGHGQEGHKELKWSLVGCFGVVWGFFSFLETARRENSPGCLILVSRVGMDTPFASDPTLSATSSSRGLMEQNPLFLLFFFSPFPLIRDWFAPAPASHFCPQAETPQVLPMCVPRSNVLGSSSGWGAHQHPWVPAGCRRLQLHGKEKEGAVLW